MEDKKCEKAQAFSQDDDIVYHEVGEQARVFVDQIDNNYVPDKSEQEAELEEDQSADKLGSLAPEGRGTGAHEFLLSTDLDLKSNVGDYHQDEHDQHFVCENILKPDFIIRLLLIVLILYSDHDERNYEAG